MSATRILAVIMLWAMALVPLWLGGTLLVVIVWPAYRAGAPVSASVAFPPIGFLPGCSLVDGEIVPFVFRCLLVAAGLVSAGCFVVSKRDDDDDAATRG